MECGEDDSKRVWRLETLLAAARATASEQKRWNETLHDSLTKKGVTIGEQDREIERLQEENERLRDESAVAKENDRLRAEVLLAAEAAANVAKLVEGLEVALSCPLSHELFKNPVVSRYGHSYERGDIETWLKQNWTCPLTKKYLPRAHLVENYSLVTVADAFRAYQAGQAK